MRSGRYSVRELLAEGDVAVFCIPEIQRDYVWRRDNVIPFVADIVDGMRETDAEKSEMITQALPEKQRADYRLFCTTVLNRRNLGFLYAYFDPEVPDRYFLIDGQQRCTTIYLTLAVLAAVDHSLRERFKARYFTPIADLMSEDYRSYAMKLDYKVREATHAFLQHYVYELVVADGAVEGKLNRETLTWWQRRYDCDHTIDSLLENAKAIYEIIARGAKEDESFCVKLFEYIEDSVEFWYFDTNLSAQGEELYIYMNSRGEQLSYNENRRAACVDVTKDAKDQFGKDWDEKLQNRYFIRRGNDGVSADKGFDLFLRIVEMLHWTLGDETKQTGLGIHTACWSAFLANSTAAMTLDMTQALRDDYFGYQQAIEFLLSPASRGIEQRFPDLYRALRSIQSGRWVSDRFIDRNQKIEQRMVLPVLFCLELFKGVHEDSYERLQARGGGAICFFLCLAKHDDVNRNPADWISRFLDLAQELRLADYDLVRLLGSQSDLLRTDEKWRLTLVQEISKSEDSDLEVVFGKRLKYQELFLELTGGEHRNVLFGDVYLLFAVVFDGNSDAVLQKAAMCPFEELAVKLRRARVALQNCFPDGGQVSSAAYFMLRDFGDYTISHRGEHLWFAYDLGTCAKEHWESRWHQILVRRCDNAKPVANSAVVSYIRSCFYPQVASVAPKDAIPMPMRLFSEIARTSVGESFFVNLWKDFSYTEGRFRYVKTGDDLHEIVFKRGPSVFDIYSRMYRDEVSVEKTILVNGFAKKFKVQLQEVGDSIFANIETDDGNFKCALDKIDAAIAHFKINGTLRAAEKVIEA